MSAEKAVRGYDPGPLRVTRWICRFLLREIAFRLIARIEEVTGQENVPAEGSAVLMMNHIGFIDPIVMVHVCQRDIVPLAKVEAYDYPVVGIFPKMWGVIPVQRDGMDRDAVRQALDVLKAGELLLVAPEGTRNEALTRPREGAFYLASRGKAPIIPVRMEGTPGFPASPLSKRWREPGVKVHFGPPFRIKPGLGRARGALLEKMAQESMYALASILPDHRRGVYADLTQASMDTIEWLE
jgi:1-acyl-sn-glycerol-3-phosphate acyltransferase